MNLGAQFVYAGDNGSRVLSWFRERLRAIATCVDSALVEASLTLLYSGIDILGFLDACADEKFATRKTFTDWCEKYLLTTLRSVDGESLTALDLYAARCGILHTSSSVSELGYEGKARELFYQFRGQHGVNLMLNAKLEPVVLDVEGFATAFKEGGKGFLAALKQNKRAPKTLRNAHAVFSGGVQ